MAPASSLALFSLFFFCFPVQALQLSPGVSDVAVTLGESISATFSFQNTSSEEKTYAVDLLGVTLGPEEGDRAFFSLSEEQMTWFSLEEARLVLSGGASREVTVDIHPSTSAPAQVFVLGVRFMEQERSQRGVMVHEGAIELIFVTMGSGLEPNLNILSFDYPERVLWSFPQEATITLRNEGSGVAVPNGFVQIKNIFGSEVGLFPINPVGKRVPPGQTRTWDVPMSFSSLGGIYIVTLQGENGEAIGSPQPCIIVSPWVIGGIIGGAMIFVVALHRRRQRQT